MSIEIERRWLLTGKPDLEDNGRCTVYQSYLMADDIEVRIYRRVWDTISALTPDIPPYKLTIKGNGSLSRTEVEFILSEEQYQQLFALIPYHHIIKNIMFIFAAVM